MFYHRLSCSQGWGVLEPIPSILGRMRGTPWTTRQFIAGLTEEMMVLIFLRDRLFKTVFVINPVWNCTTSCWLSKNVKFRYFYKVMMSSALDLGRTNTHLHALKLFFYISFQNYAQHSSSCVHTHLPNAADSLAPKRPSNIIIHKLVVSFGCWWSLSDFSFSVFINTSPYKDGRCLRGVIHTGHSAVDRLRCEGDNKSHF